MTQACDIAIAEVGNGLAATLRGVDCVAGGMTQAAFGRLFAAGGMLVPVLTMLLTIYVAFFAVSLLTGRSRIGIGALTPRMMTLGLVLTFATSWVAYQSVVWNLAVGAPDQIASIITGTEGSATQLFADKIDIVFGMISEVASGGADQQQGQSLGGTSVFSPRGLLWLGATLMLLGTVGVLVTCRIALAVLLALGPVFVVLAIFPGTRGIFVGWIRGLVMLALGPLFAVLAGGIMLELSVPILSALSPLPGEINPRAAMAFFMIGAVHVALMVLVMRTAGTMVSGWQVFGLADHAGDTVSHSGSGRANPASQAPGNLGNNHAANGQSAGRPAPQRIAISGISAGVPANDASGNSAASTRRETPIYTRSGPERKPANNALSRTRGIGSRFRPATTGSMEKLK